LLAADQLTREHLLRAERLALGLARSLYRFLDRDEVVSAAYFGLVDAAYRYEDQGRSFWSYAQYRVRGEINALARRYDPRTVPLEDDHLLTSDRPPERVAVLRAILANLSGDGRQVIVLYYFHGRSQGEIAAQLGVSTSRVSKLRHRTIEQLRRRLGIEVGEDG